MAKGSSRGRRKAKGPFLSAITGRFISRAAARRWPKSSISLGGRRRRK